MRDIKHSMAGGGRPTPSGKQKVNTFVRAAEVLVADNAAVASMCGKTVSNESSLMIRLIGKKSGVAADHLQPTEAMCSVGDRTDPWTVVLHDNAGCLIVNLIM